MLVAIPAASQSITITELDGNFYLETVEVTENGTDVADTLIVKRFLGDSSALVQTLRDVDATWAGEYVRLLARLQKLDQSTRDRDLTNAASGVGVNLDSLNDETYAAQLMIDTMKMVVFLNRLSPADAALWYPLPNPPNRLVLDVVLERRPNRTLRLLNTGIAGNSRVSMESPLLFQVTNLPGISTFYQESETDRLEVWRTVNVGLPVARIVSYKQAR